jgi:hypothetical protein
LEIPSELQQLLRRAITFAQKESFHMAEFSEDKESMAAD